MKHMHRYLALFAAAALTSCDMPLPLEVEVPDELTPVEVTTGFRLDPWDDAPRVTLSRVQGGVRFFVEREHLCAMLASAGSREHGATIDVYATVNVNPAAMCVALATGVSEYVGIAPASRRMTYTVNVYERVGDGPARRIGRSTVTVD